MTSTEYNRFLLALSEHGNVTSAARQAGLSRSTLYRVRAQDSDFARAWENALDESTDRLAGEAVRRAMNGVEEVRYFKGEPIGSVRKYSDQLLMFLLRAYRPSVFGHSRKGHAPRDASNPDDARQELIQKMATLSSKYDAS